MKILAHPKKKQIGADLSQNQDKNPDTGQKKFHNREMCTIAKNPNGGWIEYWWSKLGDDKASRKISFVLQVPGKPYVVVSGIYNDDADVAKLNANLQ